MDQSAETPVAGQSNKAQDSSVHLPPIDSKIQVGVTSPTVDRRSMAHQEVTPAARTELRDPFSDLKAAFEPPKEKLKTFNLKQIVTRNGTVLMNMLERLLETTEIDAQAYSSIQCHYV